MILLQSCLLNPLSGNRYCSLCPKMEMPRSDATRRNSSPDSIFQILVDGGNPEATVVGYLCPATHPFLVVASYHTGCTSRTVLCGFGSVFQDGKTLNVRRVNGGKHAQVAKYSVDDNQRVVAAGQ